MDFKGVDPADATREITEETIKLWRAKHTERLEAEKVANKLAEEESAMKLWLVEVFNQQKFEGMLIDGRLTGVTEREVHVVADRPLLIDYIYDNRALDVLQFRITDAALFAREEEGEVVPGVGKMTIYGLFDRKA